MVLILIFKLIKKVNNKLIIKPNNLDSFLMSHTILRFSSLIGLREGSFLVLLVRKLSILITIKYYDRSTKTLLYINKDIMINQKKYDSFKSNTQHK